MKILILVDFDKTLFDTERMKEDKGSEYRNRGIDPNKYDEVYNQVKQECGFADMEKIYTRLNQAREGWGYNAREVDATFPYQNYLFPNVIEALQILSRVGEVIIFTQGDIDGDESSECYQARKIRSCNLGYPVRIFRQKVNALNDLIKGYDQVILIDDSDKVLNAVRELYPKIRCVKVGQDSTYENYTDIYEAAKAIREFISSQTIINHGPGLF
jgi:FMN phosphatase YigB (HAD superfamily)